MKTLQDGDEIIMVNDTQFAHIEEGKRLIRESLTTLTLTIKRNVHSPVGKKIFSGASTSLPATTVSPTVDSHSIRVLPQAFPG